MKIWLNQELDAQSSAFHKGEVSQLDYRLQRRKVLEKLSSESEKSSQQESIAFKRVIGCVVIIVSLLLCTILIVNTTF